MVKVTTYLWYQKDAEQAMQFYVDVFNGSPFKTKESRIVSISRFPDGPLEPPMAGLEGKVMNGLFELDGQQFYAFDGGPEFKFNEAISMCVNCGSQEEVDYFWEKLSAVPESEVCGWLKDKYGLSWQIVPTEFTEMIEDSNSEGAGRALQAMLSMKKLDVAELRKAFEGK